MPAVSIAERCRRHAEEMRLAMELQITPREARAELDRRAAADRWKTTEKRLAAKMAARPRPAAISGEVPEPRKPWWMEN